MGDYESGYPVVDLFAGPGGLGEGFAELNTDDFAPVFRSIASIEEDQYAHQTLVLRHFFRSFRFEDVPDSYYDYLASRISKEALIAENLKHWKAAECSALKITLGQENHDLVKGLIEQRLRGRKKWALIGGPPCQAYSFVGRSRMMHKLDFEEDERHFLYREYLKIITDHAPPVFVMENVKGLLSAQVNGQSMIDKIVKDLSSPIKAIKGNSNGLEYRLFSPSCSGEIKGDIDPKSFIVEAEKYGVPQARHRMFILGIRSDLNIRPSVLAKRKPPTVGQVIGSMPKIRSGVSRQKDSGNLWKHILTSANSSSWLPGNGKNGRLIKSAIKSAVTEIKDVDLETSSTAYKPPRVMRSWYFDERLSTSTSHEAKSHMESDLHRYLFVSSHGAALHKSPKLSDFPVELIPDHNNVQEGREGKMFADRFRVQLKSKVSTTVTSHMSKDGHYYIHYDPAQCRSLTVREAARLQTFPDNYFFEGTRTAQYHQVGNAVPPYLAVQIAEIVKEILDAISED